MRCAITHGTRGDTERARGMFTIPLATVRLARRIMREGHGGRPRLTPWRCTDTAPHCEQGHPRGRTRKEKGPNRPAHKISAKMNERGRVILSGAWTTSTCYKPREIERKLLKYLTHTFMTAYNGMRHVSDRGMSRFLRSPY